MRMRLVVGGGRYGLQHPHGAWQALSVLRAWLGRSVHRHDRDDCSASSGVGKDALELGPPSCGVAGDVPSNRRTCGARVRMEGRVLDPVELADKHGFPAYWRCLWDLNPPTYCSSPLSSGWPSKSSMAAVADGEAARGFTPSNSIRAHHSARLLLCLPSRDRRERYCTPLPAVRAPLADKWCYVA